MTKKKQPDEPIEKPKPEKHPIIAGPDEEPPEYPLSMEESLDIIPDDDPFNTPAYEPPSQGEGP